MKYNEVVLLHAVRSASVSPDSTSLVVYEKLKTEWGSYSVEFRKKVQEYLIGAKEAEQLNKDRVGLNGRFWKRVINFPIDKSVVLYFSGTIDKNPGGTIGWGCYIDRSMNDEDDVKLLGYVPPGPSNSINVAVYCGLNAGLLWLRVNGYKDEEIRVFGDNKMVVNQMLGKYRINKDKMYYEVAIETKGISNHFTNISYKCVSSEKNILAENLAKNGLFRQNSAKTK